MIRGYDLPNSFISGAHTARKSLSNVQAPACVAVPEPYCPNCGARKSTDAEFCFNCGQKLACAPPEAVVK